MKDYKTLPGDSRVWVYQCNRKLSDQEVTEIRKYCEEFIENWSAHGKELNAAFEIFYNRFIVLFADESQVSASGCSIDASVRFIKTIQQAYHLDLFDRLNIAYKLGNNIDTLRMNDFQTAIDKGQLSENTIVFNNLVETKELFENSWEVPMKESWHKHLL